MILYTGPSASGILKSVTNVSAAQFNSGAQSILIAGITGKIIIPLAVSIFTSTDFVISTPFVFGDFYVVRFMGAADYINFPLFGISSKQGFQQPVGNVGNWSNNVTNAPTNFTARPLATGQISAGKFKIVVYYSLDDDI